MAKYIWLFLVTPFRVCVRCCVFRAESVVAESVVVIKKLLQTQPGEHREIIRHMARWVSLPLPRLCPPNQPRSAEVHGSGPSEGCSLPACGGYVPVGYHLNGQ